MYKIFRYTNHALSYSQLLTPQQFRQSIKRLDAGLDLPTEIVQNVFSSESVFANADLSLAHIEAYGFDYDFTIATYNSNMSIFIYDEVAKQLVEKKHYPAEILSKTFDESFPIRGLMFDSHTGFLMKLDQFQKMQLDCVFYGRERVPMNRVLDVYQGIGISRDVRARMYMFSDLFAAPETCLLADVIQMFKEKKMTVYPRFIQQVRMCKCVVCLFAKPTASMGITTNINQSTTPTMIRTSAMRLISCTARVGCTRR